MRRLMLRKLRCEYVEAPLGIDVQRPRLSWVLEASDRAQRQAAYQVLVASTEELLRRGKADLWDSGHVNSDHSTQIEYRGRELRSCARCHWKVRLWGADGKPLVQSKPAVWEMGLLESSEWHGKWIARTEDPAYQPAPLLRRGFTLRDTVKRARAYVCGLGYHELYINGHKVGDRLLDPGFTRYDRRVLYVTHDITEYLRPGDNAVALMLGTGWYNVHTASTWHHESAAWRASPRLLLELRATLAGGRIETIVSDGAWKTATGAIQYDSIYGGETYDARAEHPGWSSPGFDDSAWEQAKVVQGPRGALSAQMIPPMRVCNAIEPRTITEPRRGVFVFDTGQNMAGLARLTLHGPAGTRLVMKYSDQLSADGTINELANGGHILAFSGPSQQFQTDTYVLKGGAPESWHARFCYHGFQYVQMTGFPGRPDRENLTALTVHTDAKSIGRFECSNELFNKIWRATQWSFVNNFHSIPTDCPHREKNGWTGDSHLAAEQGLLHFDTAAFYTKWVTDLADAQRDTGELPGIVPTGGWGYDEWNGPAWDSALILIALYLYLYHGDVRILERTYPSMRRYVDYLTRRAEAGIVSFGLGDWVPAKTETPVPVTSTGYYYADAKILVRAAEFLGNPHDARRYSELADSIRRAFNGTFYDDASASYANGSQTALSCALYQGLVEPGNEDRVFQTLLRRIEQDDYHMDVGILGAKYVPNVLLEHGRPDIAYRIFNQTSFPSYGYWFERGATTLWETWDARENTSRNHIMFGDVAAWFHKAITGINLDPAAPGFKHFVVKPHVLGDLTFARSEYDSAHGLIKVAWRRTGSRLQLDVRVPANATATIHVPGRNPAVVEVAGGEYRFDTELQLIAGSSQQRNKRHKRGPGSGSSFQLPGPVL